jgi:hypothetical protein
MYSVKLEGNVQLKAEPARKICINSLHHLTYRMSKAGILGTL